MEGDENKGKGHDGHHPNEKKMVLEPNNSFKP